MPEVRPATVADRPRVLETVVAAFVADPVFRYFFADPDRYADEAAVFAGVLFDLRVDRGSVWLVGEGAALAMWEPPSPGGHAGALAPLDLPAGPVERIRRYEATVAAVMPTDEHWYLGVLATDPESAGQGWGRLAMATGLAAASLAGLPSYLETASDRNVELYRRSGWEVVATALVGPLDVRVMSRPAS